MKKLLFSLALTSLVAGSALATDGGKGGDKNAKKNAAKKECSTAEKKDCSKAMSAAGGKSCCAAKNKTASLLVPESKTEASAEKVEDVQSEKSAAK